MPNKFARRTKRRVRKGGDIESGKDEDVTPMSAVPPDPERFSKYKKQHIINASKPLSAEKVSAVFDAPNPEEKQKKEHEMMMDEDPLNKDYFDNEDFTIFSKQGGKRTRKSKSKGTRKSKGRTRKVRSKGTRKGKGRTRH